jgi:hypothetical protein
MYRANPSAAEFIPSGAFAPDAAPAPAPFTGVTGLEAFAGWQEAFPVTPYGVAPLPVPPYGALLYVPVVGQYPDGTPVFEPSTLHHIHARIAELGLSYEAGAGAGAAEGYGGDYGDGGAGGGAGGGAYGGHGSGAHGGAFGGAGGAYGGHDSGGGHYGGGGRGGRGGGGGGRGRGGGRGGGGYNSGGGSGGGSWASAPRAPALAERGGGGGGARDVEREYADFLRAQGASPARARAARGPNITPPFPASAQACARALASGTSSCRSCATRTSWRSARSSGGARASSRAPRSGASSSPILRRRNDAAGGCTNLDAPRVTATLFSPPPQTAAASCRPRFLPPSSTAG